MKTRLLSALGLIMVFFMTSCSFSENITINENGSGRVSFDIDGSGIMAMAGEEIAKEGKQERIDSTFTFKELLAEKRDSIAKLPKEEQERLKSLEKFTVKMLMDSEKGEMLMNMFADFNKASELQDVMKTFGNLSSMKKQQGQPDLGMLQNDSEVTYAYDGKKFSRKVKLLDNAKKKESGEDEDMYQALFGASTYELKYTFPKKIKKVSNKSAVISADGKTVTISYSLADFFDNPKAMALDVEF